MTMFIKLENGQPVGNAVVQENLQYLFPEFNFNRVLTPELVLPLGYGIYEFTQIPEPPKYKKILEGTPNLNENGIYYQNWLIVDMNDSERLVADEIQARKVRGDRDVRLRMSDWTQLPDSPLSEEQRQEYVVYRQLLREITAQPGFPWDIIWPSAPLATE